MAVVSLSEMMEAGAHFGHQTRRWNPKMSKYIYCARNGVHIIDLVKTALCMNNAYKWTRNAAKSGKRFLFVGTKKQCSDVVKDLATLNNNFYVNKRWLGGTLTNWKTISNSIKRLEEIELFLKDNDLSKYLEDDNKIIDAMSLFPKIIERPIVVSGGEAVIGRPPENVQKLI